MSHSFAQHDDAFQERQNGVAVGSDPGVQSHNRDSEVAAAADEVQELVSNPCPFAQLNVSDKLDGGVHLLRLGMCLPKTGNLMRCDPQAFGDSLDMRRRSGQTSYQRMNGMLCLLISGNFACAEGAC